MDKTEYKRKTRVREYSIIEFNDKNMFNRLTIRFRTPCRAIFYVHRNIVMASSNLINTMLADEPNTSEITLDPPPRVRVEDMFRLLQTFHLQPRTFPAHPNVARLFRWWTLSNYLDMTFNRDVFRKAFESCSMTTKEINKHIKEEKKSIHLYPDMAFEMLGIVSGGRTDYAIYYWCILQLAFPLWNHVHLEPIPITLSPSPSNFIERIQKEKCLHIRHVLACVLTMMNIDRMYYMWDQNTLVNAYGQMCLARSTEQVDSHVTNCLHGSEPLGLKHTLISDGSDGLAIGPGSTEQKERNENDQSEHELNVKDLLTPSTVTTNVGRERSGNDSILNVCRLVDSMADNKDETKESEVRSLEDDAGNTYPDHKEVSTDKGVRIRAWSSDSPDRVDNEYGEKCDFYIDYDEVILHVNRARLEMVPGWKCLLDQMEGNTVQTVQLVLPETTPDSDRSNAMNVFMMWIHNGDLSGCYNYNVGRILRLFLLFDSSYAQLRALEKHIQCLHPSVDERLYLTESLSYLTTDARHRLLLLWICYQLSRHVLWHIGMLHIDLTFTEEFVSVWNKCNLPPWVTIGFCAVWITETKRNCSFDDMFLFPTKFDYKKAIGIYTRLCSVLLT